MVNQEGTFSVNSNCSSGSQKILLLVAWVINYRRTSPVDDDMIGNSSHKCDSDNIVIFISGKTGGRCSTLLLSGNMANCTRTDYDVHTGKRMDRDK